MTTPTTHSMEFSQFLHFPTYIYSAMRPEFIDIVKTVSEENLKPIKKDHRLDDIYPVYMTGNYYEDPRLSEFVSYVGAAAWNILSDQGYNMNNFMTVFTEMWTQEHYKHSLMEQHAHGFGSQLTGFYFLETPENCSKVLFHDPRPAKTIINLPEKDPSIATYGSNVINFEPKPGMLMFSNSWLPHAFTRHEAKKPIKFVHFNIATQYIPNGIAPACPPPAEVI